MFCRGLCHYFKKPGPWKKYCSMFKCSRYLQPSSRPLQCFLSPVTGLLKDSRGSSQSFSQLSWRNTTLQTGKDFLSLLTPELHSQCSILLPFNSPCFRVLNSSNIWVSKKPHQLSSSKFTPLCLGTFGDTHPFLLSSSGLIHLFGWDLRNIS